MMANNFIKITEIKKSVDCIDVFFEFSPNLDKYIIGNHQKTEYLDFDYDLGSCPNGIAIIPTISNLLPLVWYFDIELFVDELDKHFMTISLKLKRDMLRCILLSSLRVKLMLKISLIILTSLKIVHVFFFLRVLIQLILLSIIG